MFDVSQADSEYLSENIADTKYIEQKIKKAGKISKLQRIRVRDIATACSGMIEACKDLPF